MKKLLLIVIDGLRPESLECAHIRCINKLMQNGCKALGLQHDGPDLTLPTMSTIFTSAGPEEHAVTTNGSCPPTISHLSSLPSLIHFHYLTASFFYSRYHLAHLFPPGSLHMATFINSRGIKNVDSQLTNTAAYHLQTEKPDFCCLHLQGPDIAGTHFGYLSEPYLESVEQADQAIEILLQQLQIVGLHKEYVTMIVSSRTGIDPKEGKGGDLPWITFGPGIREGETIECPISCIDLAPTIAYILNIPPHPDWQGKIVQDIFAPTVKKLSSHHNPLTLFDKQHVRPAA